MKMKSESEVTQSCLTLCDPMDCYQAPPPVGFSRQEYWSGVPLPSPKNGHSPMQCVSAALNTEVALFPDP